MLKKLASPKRKSLAQAKDLAASYVLFNNKSLELQS